MSRIQGKEMPKRKTKADSSVGIDVSKNWLDVHVLPEELTLRVTNTHEGVRKLKRWLKRIGVDLVIVEATGKWHRMLHRSLHAGGFRVAVVDPFRVRMFAKANGILAKTDPLDARVLALFAALMHPDERPPAAPVLEHLQELVRARLSAVTERTSLKNQRAAAQGSFLRRHLARRIDRLAKDMHSLETEIARCIASDPALDRRYQILVSVPGIGATTAALLVACLPELGAASDKQIALLAGLAPIPDDSGERRGHRRIRGGRRSVRNALYLAALAATRSNPALRDFYRRLRDNGKLPKVALIAAARKLLLLANVLIADNRTWTLQPPKHA
jgi:transposase